MDYIYYSKIDIKIIRRLLLDLKSLLPSGFHSARKNIEMIEEIIEREYENYSI